MTETIPTFFQDDTYGLPDRWILDRNGNASPNVLAEALGVSRKERRMQSRGKATGAGQLLTYLSRRLRLKALLRFWDDVHRHGPRARNSLQQGVTISWDAVVFGKFLPGWHTTDSARRQPDGVDDDPTLNAKAGIEGDDSILINDDLQAASRQVLRQLYAALDTEWSGASDERRMLLADVAFACFTVFGPSVMHAAAEKAPGLLDFYRYAATKATAPADGGDEDGGRAGADPSMAEAVKPDAADDPLASSWETLAQLYAEVARLAQNGVVRQYDPTIAERLHMLIAVELPRLQALSAMSDDEVRELLARFTGLIVEVGKALELDPFDDHEFVAAFTEAWIDFFNQHMQTEVERDYFESCLNMLRAGGVEALPECDQARRDLAAAQQIASKRRVEHESASFRSRRDAAHHLAEAEMREAVCKDTLATLEDEALHRLLPPGLCIKQLPQEGYLAAVTQQAFHPSARAALVSLREYLHDAKRALALDAWMHAVQPASPNDEPVTIDSVGQPDRFDAVPQPPVAQNNQESQADHPAGEESAVASGQQGAADSAPPYDGEPEPDVLAAQEGMVQVEPTEAPDDAAPAIRQDADSTVIVEVGAQVQQGAEESCQDEYYEDPEQTAQAFHRQYAISGEVPAITIDNVALHWLQRGHLNMAAAVLGVAEQLIWIKGEALPASLFRAAYYGLNVWPGDQASHANIQRQLNFMAPQHIDELVNRRHAGKVVPYLLFAAGLQATLFTGKHTMAPRILASVADRFDRATKRMLDDLVAFSDKGYRLDLESLRKHPQQDEKLVRARQLTMLSNWRDRIINKQTGWAPARRAMRDCLHLPDFAATMAAIEADDAGAAPAVRDFVARYSTTDALHELMMTQVAKAEKKETATIENFARSAFYNAIGELVQIASDWLDDVQHRHARGNEARAFAARFLTQLGQAQTELDNRATHLHDIAQRAGAALALQAVNNLLSAVEAGSDVIWGGKRSDAHFALPAELLQAAGLAGTPDAQMIWLVDRCVRGLDWKEIIDAALAAQDYRLAMLALLKQQEETEDVSDEGAQLLEDVHKAAAENRHGLILRVRDIRTMVDNASLAGLVDDERAYQLRAELEYLEESVDKLETLDPVREYSEQIDTIARDLEAKIGGKREELQRELQEQLNLARTQLGADAVPDAWVAQVNRALADRNLAVVDEMIDHLKTAIREGGFIGVEEVGPNRFLQSFLHVEPALYAFLSAHPNPREVAKHLAQERPGGLDYPVLAQFKDALQGLVECRTQHKRTLDKGLYDTIANILAFLGIQITSPGYTQQTPAEVGYDRGDVFSRLSLSVRTVETGRGFPWFEPNAATGQVTVVLALRDWKPADLKSYLDSTGASHQRTLLLAAKPLTSEVRNALARESKKNQFTIFHVDPVLLAFLGTISHTGKPLRNFLQLSVPWTYYNPYTARDTLQPAPAEMVYGRQHDTQNLVTMGGAAIIYGGRQLGKSTLLQEAKRQFHKPAQHQYAFYRQMDRDMDRGVISKHAWEMARIRVSQAIYQAMVEAKIVNDQPGIDHQAMINIVNSELAREGRTRILMCFDEIDPLLELDSANNFGIFRGLSDLVNQPSRRIKIVIAGLQNVKRFEDAPNFPLPQLGRSLRVSILNTTDAIQLVCEPLHILGYQFEDPLLANRILAITNRHPGLIHIFCHELVRWVARKPNENVGAAHITSDDVDRIERDPDVIALIRNRFEMTLNLDKRYLVIVYGLITNNRTTGTFSAAQAKEIAEGWLPAEFKHLTEKQFEAFLVELVGLGVLRDKPKNGRVEYSLRNVNIMNLVGSAKEVEEKLLRAVEGITQDNPLYGHAFPEDATCPSPLTFKDEKFLLNPEPHGGRDLGERSTMYSVSIICGSEALGLQPELFAATLPALGEFEENRMMGRRPPRYQVHVLRDTEMPRAADFARKLDSAITQRSQTDPVMLLVGVNGDMDLTHTLDLLSVAHEASVQATALTHRVRVLFLLAPKAMWQWQSRPDLTAELELQQPFIGLERWNTTGLSNLLNRLSLENSDAEIDELQRYSHGWYFSLNMLAQKCLSRKRDAVRLADFKGQYVPLTEAKPRELQVFLGKTGLPSVPWGVPLALQLVKFAGFDVEDLQLLLMEPEFEQQGLQAEMAPALLRWLERLRVADPMPGRVQGRLAYRITPSVAAALQAGATETKA